MTIRGARFPGRYLQGPGILDQLPDEISRLGLPAVLLLDKGVPGLESRLNALCHDLFNDNGNEPNSSLVLHGGECTIEEVERIRDLAASARLIVGIGGGKTIDTAKAVAYRLSVPIIIVPTIAASDAPCSALSVFYNADGRVERDEFLPSNPNLVLVDSEIIAAAPARFLSAGIADALATWYEAQACQRSGAHNCMGVPGAAVAFMIAQGCRDILYEHAVEAVTACDSNQVTPALEQVLEANILLSGVGFESGGVAAAHAIHHGLAELPETHGCLHGEKVAIGILVELLLREEHDEFERVKTFLEQVRLPTTLGDVGLDNVTEDQLKIIAARACRQGEIIYNEPIQISEAAVIAALRQLA